MTEDVLGFEIPMEVAISMKECKPLCHFIEDSFDLGLC